MDGESKNIQKRARWRINEHEDRKVRGSGNRRGKCPTNENKKTQMKTRAVEANGKEADWCDNKENLIKVREKI